MKKLFGVSGWTTAAASPPTRSRSPGTTSGYVGGGPGSLGLLVKQLYTCSEVVAGDYSSGFSDSCEVP